MNGNYDGAFSGLTRRLGVREMGRARQVCQQDANRVEDRF